MEIRQATPFDEPAITKLLNRPEATQPVGGVKELIAPKRSLVWIALEGQRAVGLSCALLRKLRFQQQTYNTGYWAHLYVDPDYRDRMLYPMLPMRMFQSLETDGIDFLYAAIRRPAVTRAHLKLGLQEIGQQAVLLKPLKPLTLISRQKKCHPLIQNTAPWLDIPLSSAANLYRQAWQLLTSSYSSQFDIPHAKLAKLMQDSSEGYIQQDWTAEAISLRYQDLPGVSYRVCGTGAGETLKAAVISRRVRRDTGVVACVILEVRHLAGCEKQARHLLLQAESEAVQDGCDAMVILDGHGSQIASVLRRLGYLRTPETYTLMVWPKKIMEDFAWLADFPKWRFTFGDHDAF